tara:strand:+ start:1420 stop:1572 length:153 start_codon:yes stop_codon:yes gene_type:complete
MRAALAGFFVSSGGFPGMKRISTSKELENQKDNVNVTLCCLYDCIAFDVG